MSVLKFVAFLGFLLSVSAAHANRCGEFIYNKNGKLRKYAYLNNTVLENTKAHGSSTTSGLTTESTTAGSDPGVTTGVWGSWTQSVSSEGDCKWGGAAINSIKEYHLYLAQNLHEIKREIAVGSGGHLEIMASIHQCSPKNQQEFNTSLQKNLSTFIDFKESEMDKLANALEGVAINICSIRKNPRRVSI